MRQMQPHANDAPAATPQQPRRAGGASGSRSPHCTASSSIGLGCGAPPPGKTWARPLRRRSCRPARRPRQRTTRASRGRPGRAGGGGAGTRGPDARCASGRSRAAASPPPPGPEPARALSKALDSTQCDAAERLHAQPRAPEQAAAGAAHIERPRRSPVHSHAPALPSLPLPRLLALRPL